MRLRLKTPSVSFLGLLLGLFWVFLGLALPGGAYAKDSRIYVLYGTADMGTWESAFHHEFFHSLVNSGEPYQLYTEFLGYDDHLDAKGIAAIDGILALKVARNPPDLVISVLPAAGEYLDSRAETLFRNAAKVYVIPPQSVAAKRSHDPHTRLLLSSSSQAIRDTISLMLGLYPKTERVFVVGGVSVTDRAYWPRVEQELKSLAPSVERVHWEGHTRDELVAESATIPPHSLVFFTSAEIDRNGKDYQSSRLAEAISAAAPVPMFGFYDTLVGSGIVGGNVTSSPGYARGAFTLASNLLEEEGTILSPQTNSFVFDERQVRRWGIEERALPAQATILFREQSFWSNYGLWILLALVVALSQTLLLAVLARTLSLQKRTERALRQSLAQVETIGENFHEGMIYQVITGPGERRRFTYLSPSVELLYGVSAEEAKRDPGLIYGRIHEDHRARLVASEVAAIQSLTSFRDEVQIRNPDNSLRWSYLVSTPRDQGDGSILWDGIEINITERKRMEETRQRLQDQLSVSQKLESVGRLAGGVAHDFNNMLSVIQGNLSLLEPLLTSETQQRRALKIRDASDRAARLVRQLLASARKQPTEPEVLDLEERVRGMHDLLSKLVGENIDLRMSFGPALAHVLLDPSQLDQIVSNLCINARDAIEGSGTISISVENSTDPGAAPTRTLVCLEVKDSGRGMDAETQAHLFEPFFTTKALGQGTGLGLATVKGIAEQNGGFVTVTSKPGQGSTFRVFLPTSQVASVPSPRTPSLGYFPQAHVSTVLIVEDEPDILEVLELMVQSFGYSTLAAGSPSRALELAVERGHEIDLVLTDLIMPGMNGVDLVQRIRSLGLQPKVIFLSGYTADLLESKGVVEANHRLLEKPFEPQQLARELKEALDEKK